MRRKIKLTKIDVTVQLGKTFIGFCELVFELVRLETLCICTDKQRDREPFFRQLMFVIFQSLYIHQKQDVKVLAIRLLFSYLYIKNENAENRYQDLFY